MARKRRDYKRDTSGKFSFSSSGGGKRTTKTAPKKSTGKKMADTKKGKDSKKKEKKKPPHINIPRQSTLHPGDTTIQTDLKPKGKGYYKNIQKQLKKGKKSGKAKVIKAKRKKKKT